MQGSGAAVALGLGGTEEKGGHCWGLGGAGEKGSFSALPVALFLSQAMKSTGREDPQTMGTGNPPVCPWMAEWLV